MFSLNLRESTDLEFAVTIDGTAKKVDLVYLVIEGLQYSINLPCKFDNQTVKVEVPILEGVLGDGHHNVHLVMVIDGKMFRPFNDVVNFEKPLVVETTLKNVSSITESLPKIDARPVMVKVAKQSSHPTISALINESKAKLENATLVESVNLVGSVLQSLKKEPGGTDVARKWITSVEAEGKSITQITSSKDAWELLDGLKAIITN